MLTYPRIASAVVISLALAALAFAAVPQTINYQGYVKNSATGAPLHAPTPTGITMTFSLYSSNPVRSNPVWRETQPTVAVDHGIFSVQLGSATPITAPFDVPYYLGVNVNSAGELPLQPLDAVPYALRSGVADNTTSISGQTLTSLDSRYVDPTRPIPTAQQLATLRWDQVRGGFSSIPVGANPHALAFDGNSIWVTNYSGNSVQKINPATGVVVGTPIPVGANPYALAFDGSSIWVANMASNNIMKINATTGTVMLTIAVGNTPHALAFDGSSIWVANYFSNNVQKINPANGAILGTYPVLSNPFALAFDGSSLWVSNWGNNSVQKINTTTGTAGGAIIVGTGPTGLAFDGSSIWVANNGSNSVQKINPTTGVTGTPITVGSAPSGLAFDGSSIWVSNWDSNSVMKINPITGVVGAAIPAGPVPAGLAFDGSSIWVANYSGNSVTKLSSAAEPVGVQTVGTGQLTNSAVTTTTIADSSVTDAKIGGIISAAKLDLSNIQKKYAKVAVVALSGGDYTNPYAAWVGLTSWCGTPSATNTCLIKIMPGIYDLGSNFFNMQSFVDIEGSGQDTTTITGAVASSDLFTYTTNGVINGANDSEIRNITIENTGSGNYVIGVYNNSIFKSKLTNLTISVHSSSYIYSSYGILNTITDTAMNNIIINSKADTYTHGVYNNSSTVLMSNMSISANNGVEARGVYNISSSPVMTNIISTAFGATTNKGLINTNSSTPTVSGLITRAYGGVDCFAIYNLDSQPILSNVIADASGGSSSIGIYNSFSAPILSNVTTIEAGVKKIITGGANVGIGTYSPTVALDVAGDVNVSGTLTAGNLGANTVKSAAIAAGSVTTAAIADGAITSAKIATPLGIGTTTPGFTLDVNGNARVKTNFDIATGLAQIGFNRNSTNGAIYDNAHKAWQMGPIGAGDPFVISTWDSTGAAITNPMIITTDGNIGIGTSAPKRSLHLAGGPSAEMNLESTNGLTDWKTWNFLVDGNAGGAKNLTFRILNDAGTAAMRNNLILWNNGNATLAGTMTANGALLTSDLRLKTDIQPLENTLDKVQRLRGVSYVMKDDQNSIRKIGVIAQELEQEYPELVATDDKGMKSVAYANLTAVLIEAVKGLKAENVLLRARLERLENAQSSDKREKP